MDTGKLILKSPYLKCGGTGTVSGYMRYIATRENVQIVADDRPATKRQEQLIRSLTKDSPDTKELFEYEDWSAAPTKAHASAFITAALDVNWDAAGRSDMYMKYIAMFPTCWVSDWPTHMKLSGEGISPLSPSALASSSPEINLWCGLMPRRRKRMRDFNSYSLAFVVCVGVDKEAIS